MAEVEGKILDRVRKLLSKAESASNFGTPEGNAEAEAFMVKAQKMIADNAISEAMLRAGQSKSEDVEMRKIRIQGPYAQDKITLMNQVAKTNGVELLHTGDQIGGTSDKQVTVIGFPSDLDSVDLLYTSLLMQMVNECIKAAKDYTPVPGYGGGRDQFKRSFMYAFSQIVRDRLNEAMEMAKREARTTHGTGVSLVLADRGQMVKSEMERLFPHIKTTKRKVAWNGAGHGAGKAAGARATLGGKSVSNKRPALKN